jgi:hypothetical protein
MALGLASLWRAPAFGLHAAGPVWERLPPAWPPVALVWVAPVWVAPVWVAPAWVGLAQAWALVGALVVRTCGPLAQAWVPRALVWASLAQTWEPAVQTCAPGPRAWIPVARAWGLVQLAERKMNVGPWRERQPDEPVAVAL